MGGVKTLWLWVGILAAALVVGPSGAQVLGPPSGSSARVAKTALLEARQLVQQDKSLPRESIFEVGLLQAVLGNLEEGLATITSTADATGPAGPRWRALAEAALLVSQRGDVDAVQKAADRTQGADRAALQVGLTEARYRAGDEALALLTASEVGGRYPAVAAALLVRLAADAAAGGKLPTVETLGRILELGQKIPAAERNAAGDPAQADVLTDLMLLHVAAGNDDAALRAADSVSDPDDRQRALSHLVTLQVGKARFDAAVGTAQKLGGELVDPPSSAALQVAALCRVARAQVDAGLAPAGLVTAKAALESARRVVDGYRRARSLLVVSEVLSRGGDKTLGSNAASEALALAFADQDQRAMVLLYAARAQHVAGVDQVAQVTFTAAREVVARSKQAATWEAALTVPAALGLTSEAVAGLALFQKDPAGLRQARIVLARALAANGYRDDAVAVARGYTTTQPADRHSEVQALCEVVANSPGAGAGSQELLKEALALTGDPLDLDGIQLVADTGADAALPAVAVAAYAKAIEGAAKARRAESEIGLPRLIVAVSRALKAGLAAGQNAPELATQVEQAAGTSRDDEARSATMAILGRAFAENGSKEAGQSLLHAAEADARKAALPERRAALLAQQASVAALCGFDQHAQVGFDTAEALLEEMEHVPPAVLLVVAESEMAAGRTSCKTFLLRSAMTVESLGRDGSTDLLRLARVADYVGQPAEALAIARRVLRSDERLQAYLDLARILAGRPVRPLREPGYYPLPANVEMAAG
ncbi:MAG: hypothetical protein HYU66_29570 [Armatimonadetes bacterium]|nr:hypothetical protein [Armatimonadota bacterium]